MISSKLFRILGKMANWQVIITSDFDDFYAQFQYAYQTEYNGCENRAFSEKNMCDFPF